MQLVSKQIHGYMDKASWIRKMFEKGAELKGKYGEENVCDFSLGNPDLPPPPSVADGLRGMAEKAGEPFAFGYMPNFGYPDVRESLAGYVSKEQGTDVPAGNLVITCGAAGALNAFLRTVMDPGEEVLVPAPFFVEYGFYCENHGAVLKPVPAKPLTFELDIDAIDAAITEQTRVVLINSPNNPSGAVYSRESLEQLAEVLTRHSEGRERPIFLLSDEPYRFLAYDGVDVPSLLPLYPHTVVCSSFSKNLSLAGARVGYALVNPAMPDAETLLAGLVMSNRILGFVNAPALGQRLLPGSLGSQVDISIYDARRKAMAEVLDAAGLRYTMPKGAFYFFPEAPGGDDVEFTNILLEQRILAVPGKGFGYPGYFRLTFCVGEDVIRRSAEGFKKAVEVAGK